MRISAKPCLKVESGVLVAFTFCDFDLTMKYQKLYGSPIYPLKIIGFIICQKRESVRERKSHNGLLIISLINLEYQKRGYELYMGKR